MLAVVQPVDPEAFYEQSGDLPTPTPPLVTLPPQYELYERVFSPTEAQFLAPLNNHAHAIDIEGDEVPPYGPIYPLAEPELEVLRQYLHDALARGWIRPSRSPTGAPILFVPKKGGQLRLCVDYRALNRVTRKNRAPLPLISEILDRLAKAKIYTKLDLKDAYHRLRIKPGDEWKTAFRCRYGHFEYCVLPFGLANAPATFQSFINEVLGELIDTICIVYLDDILIYSNSPEEHEQHVRCVLEKLQQHNLYANLAKCAFHVVSVNFLGYIIDPEGIKMEPTRIDAIRDWPQPRTVRDIQVFLGFAGFYRRFIRNYSKVTAPLTDLLKGETIGQIQFGPKEIAAFTKLRLLFTQTPFLRHYDPQLPTKLETDASAFAIGAVLSQLWEDHWHPVAFLSRKLHGAELRYDTPDAELMAIVEAFRSWRPYLAYVRATVEVWTDHLNHRYLATKPKLSPRQARWMEELAIFDFTIEYREGKKNPADGLSRRPDHRDGGEAAEAMRAPLANFLDRFVSEKGHRATGDIVGTSKSPLIRRGPKGPSIVPQRKGMAQPAGKLVRSLNLAEAVRFGQDYANSATCPVTCEEPGNPLQRGRQPRGPIRFGRPDPKRGVQDDVESRGLPASIVGVTGRDLDTPWSRISNASIPTLCAAAKVDLGARKRDDGLITALPNLLPPLVEALRDAQKRDAFVAIEKWTK
jgi:hypothetical protein